MQEDRNEGKLSGVISCGAHTGVEVEIEIAIAVAAVVEVAVAGRVASCLDAV